MKFLLISLLFLIGCSLPKVKGPFNPQIPSEGNAVVYIYRLDTNVDSANPDIPVFFVNDKKQGKLMIGGHFVEMVKPGKVEVAYKNPFLGIRFPWKSRKIEFSIKANEVYYVRFGVEGITRATHLTLISKNQAESEIKTTKEIE